MQSGDNWFRDDATPPRDEPADWRIIVGGIDESMLLKQPAPLGQNSLEFLERLLQVIGITPRS